jgi:alanyl-tRNA synthetase
LENRDFIMRVISLEEERFARAIQMGLPLLEDVIIPLQRQLLEAAQDKSTEAKQKLQDQELPSSVSTIPAFVKSWNERLESLLAADTADQAADLAKSELAKLVNGADAFLLWDTFGVPPELTAEIAREHGFQVNMDEFNKKMEDQRQQSRAAHAFQGAMEMLPTYENLGVGTVGFVGYTQVQQRSRVAALLVEAEGAGQASAVGHAVKGQRVEVVLDSTPFYAESGGQVGDAGTISGPNGRVRVEDTQTPVAGLIVHRGVVEGGDISLGEEVDATVDPARRRDAARNHSATHLLHASLRHVLGSHVRQAGSLVAPDRLRFDYSHVAALTRDELLEVQGLTNQKVQENLSISTTESTYTEAVQQGALAFFGDKYGDVVRMVRMGPDHNDGGAFSLEVCGGTHVHATGQVGPLFIVAEASVGGGMRRVEAVAGPSAERLFMERSALLDSLAAKLQTPVVDLEARLESFMEDADQVRRRLATFEREALRREAQTLLDSVADVDGVKVLAGRTSAGNAEAMREMGDFLKARLESAVLVMGGIVDDRPTLVAMVTDDLVASGLHAGNIVKEAAQVMGGGGGGRPNLAQAGGRHADRLDASLQSVADIVRRSRSQG